MADGYARMTGKPGVCMVITGPGLSNIATAMLQARADSIPILVIAASNDPAPRSLGRLHEMPDQAAFGRQIASLCRRINRPEDLPGAIDSAFAMFRHGRPGPALLEIPLGVMRAEVSPLPSERRHRAVATRSTDRPDLGTAAEALRDSTNSVMIMGGGGRHSASEALELAMRLDAPLIATINARSCLPVGHPLAVYASPSLAPVRRLVDRAELVLAIGTELGPTDFDICGEGQTLSPRRLLRIDIDPRAFEGTIKADTEMVCDAKLALCALLEQVTKRRGSGSGAARAAAANQAAHDALSAEYRVYVRILELIRDIMPEGALVGDSTQIVYAGNLYFPAGDRGRWFNSSVGFGTLGYALSAALGAKLARPQRPVVALIGDGGLQFTLGELATAVELGLAVPILLWNNRGYGEIKSYMAARGIPRIGVDIYTPDFQAIARGFGCRAARAEGLAHLEDLLRQAHRASGPTLIEIDESEALQW